MEYDITTFTLIKRYTNKQQLKHEMNLFQPCIYYMIEIDLFVVIFVSLYKVWRCCFNSN